MCRNSSVGLLSLATILLIIGLFSISWQFGVLLCAIANGSSYTLSISAYRSSEQEFSTDLDVENQDKSGFYYIHAQYISSLYIGVIEWNMAHNMALSGIGFFAGTIYIITGIFAYLLSRATRPGVLSIGMSKKKNLLKLFKVFSVFGVVFSILLLSFSIYMTYIMSFWWELFIYRYFYSSWSTSSTSFFPKEALMPVILHLLHAIISIIGLGVCIRGCFVKMPASMTVKCLKKEMQTLEYKIHPANYVIPYPGYTKTYPELKNNSNYFGPLNNKILYNYH